MRRKKKKEVTYLDKCSCEIVRRNFSTHYATCDVECDSTTDQDQLVTQLGSQNTEAQTRGHLIDLLVVDCGENWLAFLKSVFF